MFGVAYDSGRGRLLLFGGETYPNAGRSSDVWEWDGLKGTWSLTPAIGMPGTLNMSSAAYDPVRRRVIVHADWEGGVRTLEWDTDGGTWTNTNVGNAPRVTGSSSFVWDPCRNRGVYFGGQTGDELWDWNPTHAAGRSTRSSCPGRRRARSRRWCSTDRRAAAPCSVAGTPHRIAVRRPATAGPDLLQRSLGVDRRVCDMDAARGRRLPETVRPRMERRRLDSARARLVIFGGGSETADLDDVWEWKRQ
jgi:hypothetical protein